MVKLSILFTLYWSEVLERKMKIWNVVVFVGTMIFILGMIFHLQGQSVIGPESSFMYANPEWVSYGILIVISGIVISGVGISIKLIKKS